MARPRKMTYTLDMYLRKNMNGEIDNKADVQREFAWRNEQVNELVVTVLTDDYIPPIILGEEENSKLHIVDGGCRTIALIKFRKGLHKITSSIENPFIPYKRKTVDASGGVTYEDAVFNIKNKTYDKLPEELKEKFDEYQIETVIHEDCDSHKISRYIKRYNNHVSMSTDQKAFTYMDKFAGRIRKILDSRFFVNCNSYSEKDKAKGAVERIVVETIMCMNHFGSWKTGAKSLYKYLNDHASMEEFDVFEDNLHRLENIITEDVRDIFNKKDSFIFLTLFDRFAKLQVEDNKFAEFLRAFKRNIRFAERNEKGLLFDEIDKDLSTKDKQVITEKLEFLEKWMLKFLHVGESESDRDSIEEFVAGCLGIDTETIAGDMDFYEESLDRLEETAIRDGSKLLNPENHPSLLAMMVYSYKEDKDLDQWLTVYAGKNNTYFADQKKNYIHMRNEFERYCRENIRSA